MAPPWLAGALAAILLVIAGYCATRLAAARRWQRSTDHGADVMHVVMGVAMAGMLVPRLNPLQTRAWAVLFAAGAAWFAGQAIRARRRGRAYARSRAELPRAAVSRAQHGAHVLSCSAMVYMLLADPAASARMGAGPGAGLLPVAALILAIAVSVSVVVSTDRLPALRPAPIPVTPAYAGPAPAQAGPTLAQAGPTLAQAGPTMAQAGPTMAQAGPTMAQAGPTMAEGGPAPSATGQAAGAGGAPAPAGPAASATGRAAAGSTTTPAGPRAVLCPRLAACCQIMMGVAMAYMLISML